MTQFIPDRITRIKQTFAASCVYFQPRLQVTTEGKSDVAFWRCTLCGTQTRDSVWDLICICTESVFFFALSPSLPCNYAAAECLSGRRGSTSGWSRHFLAASSTSTIGDLHFAVISALPQQTNPLPVSNPLPLQNNLLDYILSFTFDSSTLCTLLLFTLESCKRNYSPSLFAVCGCQRCLKTNHKCRFFRFLLKYNFQNVIQFLKHCFHWMGNTVYFQ